MASVTKQLQDAIATQLRLITTANSYHNTVRLVTKKYLTPDKMNSVPVIIVMRGMCHTEVVSEDGALKKSRRSFGIIGFTKWDADNSDEGKGSDAIDELEEDIVEALYAGEDTILAIEGAKSMEIVPLEAILIEEKLYGWAQVGVIIEHYHEGNV